MGDELLTSEQLTKNLYYKPVLTQQQHKERRKYAVIINGDFSEFHKGNVKEAYTSMKVLGFVDENIYILSTENPRADVIEKINGINAHATAGNVNEVFDSLQKMVDTNDMLVLYTTGHGKCRNNEATLQLEDTDIIQTELKKQLAKAKAQDYVIVCDQCYSGGIASELSTLEGNVVAYSSTDAKHITLCESFARPFWESFRNGNGDKNKDGKTTLDEAFEYAAEIHRAAANNRQKKTNHEAHAYRSKNYPKELR